MKTKLKYIPTRHALDRARIRFGIASDKAVKWINELMQGAKYVASNGRNGLTYEKDGIRIVVDGTTNAVITLYPALRTDFLRPALEREMRKIKRESTREIRELERRLAKAYAELSERMMNYANARNPKTRASIGERISEVEAIISEVETAIERLQDESGYNNGYVY